MSLALQPMVSSFWYKTQLPKMHMSQWAPCPNVPPSPLHILQFNSMRHWKLDQDLHDMTMELADFYQSMDTHNLKKKFVFVSPSFLILFISLPGLFVFSNACLMLRWSVIQFTYHHFCIGIHIYFITDDIHSLL